MDSRLREAGESLVELLLAIAIIGIAFGAILAGLGTAVTVSGVNRHQAEDTSHLRGIAERIQSASWVTCAGTAHYTTALSSLPAPSGSSRSIAVAYWDGLAFTGVCVPTTTLHKVTIMTTPADTRAQAPQALEVVKRKP